MITDFLIIFIQIVFGLLEWAVLIHVLYSWIRPFSTSFFYQILTSLVTPFYRIVRSVVPRIGPFDFSPLLSLLLIQLVGSLCINLVIRFMT